MRQRHLPSSNACEHTALHKEIIDLLESINPAIYRHACPQLKCGSVGGHVRHCIEFYQCYNKHSKVGLIDYDARARNPDLEAYPIAAILALRKLLPPFEKITHTISQTTSLKVRESGADWLDSTHGREQQFLFSHTVHHMALIALILRSANVSVPENFGIAPSTLAFRNECNNSGNTNTSPCAQ